MSGVEPSASTRLAGKRRSQAGPPKPGAMTAIRGLAWDVFRTSKDGPAMLVTVRDQLDSVRRHD